MRKSAWLALGAGALAIILIAIAERPSTAQQAAPAAPANVVLAAGDTSTLKGPRQPVFFRHDIHAGQYEITCQYCHYSVSVASEHHVARCGQRYRDRLARAVERRPQPHVVAAIDCQRGRAIVGERDPGDGLPVGRGR